MILVRHPISTSTKWYQCGFPFIDIVSNSTLFICPISFTAFGGYTYRIHSYEILSIQFFIFRYRCRMKWIIVRYPIPPLLRNRIDLIFVFGIVLNFVLALDLVFCLSLSYQTRSSFDIRYPPLRNRIDLIFRFWISYQTRFSFDIRSPITTKSYRFDFRSWISYQTRFWFDTRYP